MTFKKASKKLVELKVTLTTLQNGVNYLVTNYLQIVYKYNCTIAYNYLCILNCQSINILNNNQQQLHK